MNTKIFKSYDEFLNRKDKSLNGVSEGFSKNNPNYLIQNKANVGCWNCSHCDDCSHCSDCFRCSDCSDCFRCSHCDDCHDCSHCSHCSGCFRCSHCDDCFYCSDCSDNPGQRVISENIPKIENIHNKILDACLNDDSLDMNRWHTCETTHCRAGWVVHLAGEEGKKLEEKTSTAFAAMMIYKKSSNIPVSPVRFYDNKENAMQDIKRCAEMESKI